MSLESTLFRDDPALQACLTSDRAHLTRGASGEHVGRLQFALFAADGLVIEESESFGKIYGPSTAAAVLAYKTRRSIINRAYQSTPDDIVGKMTIAALDREMLSKQGQPGPKQSCLCGSDPRSALGRSAFVSSRSEAVDQQAIIRISLVDARSPHEMALDRVGAATSAIAKTRAVLGGLINFRPIIARPFSAPFLPVQTMALFDKVWRNFGPPKNLPFDGFGEFPPITTRTEFLSAIDSHYALMQRTLARASSLFKSIEQDVLGPTTQALTLMNDRVVGDPPDLPVGIYFGQLFAASSSNLQTEVVIHESSHFKDGHHFGDHFTPDSTNWGKFDGAIGVVNAWSYSMFVLDVLFNRTTTFPS